MELLENRIFNEDCFEVFKRMPNEVVDLVITDLPYGQVNQHWDKLINHEEMWKQLKRILKPNGQVLFFCSTLFGYELIKSNPSWFRYDLVFKKKKSVGFFNCNKLPLRSHEMIYIFSPPKPKGLKWTYNPQKTIGKPYTAKEAQEGGGAVIYSKNRKKNAINNTGDRFPISVLEYGIEDKKVHPTQKPIKLLENLIKQYSNEGDLIMDFTMGSGSAIIAAKNTNRKYVGVEKDTIIFNKANDFINSFQIL
jgi:site-specific DNA-methyltransferase (adenine-specific)